MPTAIQTWTLLIQCSQQNQESTKSMEAKRESTWHCLLPQYRSEVCVFWPGQLCSLRCNKDSQCTHGNFSSERFLASPGQESLRNWAFGKNKNSIIYNIIYICMYMILYHHPKSKRAEPHSIHPLGILLKNQFPPTTSLVAWGRAWPSLRGNYSPHCIPAAGETLVAQTAHCFGSSSEVPWHTSLVPPALLPGTPNMQGSLPTVSNPQPQRGTPGCSPQEPLNSGGINSACSQSPGFACELRSLLSTRHVSERSWFQPAEGSATYTKYPICTLQFHCALVFTTLTRGIWDWAL